jgi:hypothetical protein
MIEVIYLTDRLSRRGARNFANEWLKTHDKLPKAIIREHLTFSGKMKVNISFVEPPSKDKIDLRRTYLRDEKDLKEINLESLK